MIETIQVRKKVTCDGCHKKSFEYDAGHKQMKEGWESIDDNEYCPECSKLRHSDMAEKYPSGLIVHTPSGILYACLEHANQACVLYQFMGAHVTTETTYEKVACINCINEAKAKT